MSEFNFEVDRVIARAVESLTPNEKIRLKEFLSKESDSRIQVKDRLFHAYDCDFTNKIQHVEVVYKQKRFLWIVKLTNEVWWESGKLYIQTDVPDTVITAMRGKKLTNIVDHELFEDIIVSSAKRVEKHFQKTIEITTKKLDKIALEFSEENTDKPCDFEEILKAKGINHICKAVVMFYRRLNDLEKNTFHKRIKSDVENFTDLIKSKDLEAVRIWADNDTLCMSASVINGVFRTGSLTMYPGKKSISRILRNPMFLAYGNVRANTTRRPKESTIPIEKIKTYLVH